MSGPAGVTGYIVGGPTAPSRWWSAIRGATRPGIPVVVKVNAPGPAGVSSLLVAVAEGSAVNPAFPTTQAIFHFDGTGRTRSRATTGRSSTG